MVETSRAEKDNGKEAEKANSLSQTLRESHDLISPEVVVQAAELLLPDFKCLRCGNEKFVVGPLRGATHFMPSSPAAISSRAEIICTRCGMVEVHSTSFLIESALSLGRENHSDER